MSHEESITVTIDGKHINIPTKLNGKKLSDKEAIKAFRAGKLKKLGGPFKTINKAVAAAKSRSRRTDPKTNKIKPKRRGVDRVKILEDSLNGS